MMRDLKFSQLLMKSRLVRYYTTCSGKELKLVSDKFIAFIFRFKQPKESADIVVETFQVTQMDPRSSLMMADYCRNM
jgi:hypothetical protein